MLTRSAPMTTRSHIGQLYSLKHFCFNDFSEAINILIA